MKILAVDFSSEERGVAVWDSQTMTLLGKAVEHGGRRAIELVEAALAQAGCEREAIDLLAVGLGPGSYTGIRGAISLAQGWQLGRNVKVTGISSAECLAAQCAQSASTPDTIHLAIDAQRNEFYLAKWEITGGQCRENTPLRIVPASEIEALCHSGQRVVGPGIAARFKGAENLYPSAVTLARLAATRPDSGSAEHLEPIYLRETTFKKAPPPRDVK